MKSPFLLRKIMDLTRIIYPSWIATRPTFTAAPTPIATEEQLRNACGSDGARVALSADIGLTAPLVVTGKRIRIEPATVERKSIYGTYSGQKSFVKLDGAQQVDFSGIILNPNQEDNNEMIAVVANGVQDLTFEHVGIVGYGRMGVRFEKNCHRATFDGCWIDGRNKAIYHGIGVSDDGPNSQFVIVDTTILRNGVNKKESGSDRQPEYGLDFHGDKLITTGCTIIDNGRCVKFPDGREAWVYDNLLSEGVVGDLYAIHIYQGYRTPDNLHFFNNDIYATRGHAHLSYQNGPNITWMDNRTFDLGGDETVPERIRRGPGGGTLVRESKAISEFLLQMDREPPTPEPPTDDRAALIAEVKAAVLAEMDYGLIAMHAAGLIELPEISEDLANALAELAVQRIALALMALTPEGLH